MQTQLRDTLQQISSSATQLAAAAEEMTAITEDGVQGIQRQNNEIDQAATAVNEMTSAVEEVARNAEHTARSSSNATSAAQDGLGLVKKTVTSINTMSTDVQKTATLIGELAGQSRDIGKVLDVIRGLAEQTNLLALNAAIEAARAGEAGRGFAVVADEVRALAHRTQQSTSEIERLVTNIQNGTERAVGSMRGNTELASETLGIAEGANESLTVISAAVSEINDLNLVIASAAQQQAHVAREVDRNLIEHPRPLGTVIIGRTTDRQRKPRAVDAGVGPEQHRGTFPPVLMPFVPLASQREGYSRVTGPTLPAAFQRIAHILLQALCA